MKWIVVLLLALTSVGAFAAFPCPVDSCNPHNGCVEGCNRFAATGTAACYDVEAAKEASLTRARRRCYRGLTMMGQWRFSETIENGECVFKAHADFICYQ